MHFRIIVENGHFPLQCECSTAHEAYGCIEALKTGLLRDATIDMDEIMDTLVKMKNGERLSTKNYRYSISVVEGEI